jgi:hypothetical protein
LSFAPSSFGAETFVVAAASVVGAVAVCARNSVRPALNMPITAAASRETKANRFSFVRREERFRFMPERYHPGVTVQAQTGAAQPQTQNGC